MVDSRDVRGDEDGMPRTLPWNLIMMVWNQLSSVPPVVSTHSEVTSAVVAYCDPRRKLDCVLEAWQAQGVLERMCQPAAGQLWIRVGVDGVKMWKSSIISVTLCPTCSVKGVLLH